jgi:hypothetical protein
LARAAKKGFGRAVPHQIRLPTVRFDSAIAGEEYRVENSADIAGNDI